MERIEMLTLEAVTEYDDLPVVFRSTGTEMDAIPEEEFKKIMEGK